MSVEQARRNLNQLDKELADLEKKLANEAKKEADKTKKINDTQRSISKNISASMLQSKTRQIQGYQNDLVKTTNQKADINRKIADKRKKRSEAAQKIQKEELTENKKLDASQKKIYANYESRISDLSSQLTQRVITQNTHIYSETDDEEYDVFISHASEDKASFTNELCKELQKTGNRFRYDCFRIAGFSRNE